MQTEISLTKCVETLSQVDIFRHLPAGVLEDMSVKMKLQSYPSGSLIIRKDDKGNSMHVIFEGDVKVHDGEMEVVTLSKGNFFGEFSLLDEEPRSMSVSAKTDVVTGTIFQNDFYQVLNRHPEVTKDVMKTLIKRLREQNGRIIRQMKQRAEELEQLVKERTAEVVQQKVVVETKNKEIVDSIHYAKRLQHAILPSAHVLEQFFPESFVLYLPKDIVAGDFYWMNRTGNHIIVAAADCTGHGVSGALMSMLGISLLNHIVHENKINSPSVILDHLHTSVIAALNQTKNDTNDGMDIAVCKFDLKKNEVQFAGANRPLWLLRNGEMQVIAPDKKPVGGLQLETTAPFTNNTLSLQKGDVCYLFTDGFPDQFGGEKGKKLMTKNFKDILQNTGNLKMEAQKNYLAEYFERWKANTEQVDDVLVLGMRIAN